METHCQAGPPSSSFTAVAQRLQRKSFAAPSNAASFTGFEGVSVCDPLVDVQKVSTQPDGQAPEDQDLAPPAGGAGTSKNILFLIVLLVFGIYVDSSVTLWQKLYRINKVRRCNPECKELFDAIQSSTERDKTGPCIFTSQMSLHMSTDIDSFGGVPGHFPTSAARLLSGDDKEFMVNRGCDWFLEKEAGESTWTVRPYSFTTGVALAIACTFALLVFWAFNYASGGLEQLGLCFDIRSLLAFSPVGLLFGFSSVCGFKAQKLLSPGSYALYSQLGIVLIPILWRIMFRKALASVTWLHILMIAFGMILYRLSEMDLTAGLAEILGGEGLLWVIAKVIATACASVWAERFLKRDRSIPFSVMTTYILPWKAVMCLVTVFILPPHGLPDRAGGPFHDWTFLTFVILAHTIGDSVLAALIAKTFDSVVKAIASVVGIIFPVWVVSWSAGWEEIDVSSPAGQLKLAGGVLVIMACFAYVLGRAQSMELEEALAKVECQTASATCGPARSESIEMAGEGPRRTASGALARQ